MKSFFPYILVCLLLAGIFSACQDTEVLETYEEVKEEVQRNEPFCFNAYISSANEDNATTRANLSYLTSPNQSDVGGTNALKYIPCLGLSLGNNGTYGSGGKEPYIVYNYDIRHGWTALNSYIVGVYGFAHNDDSWETMVSNNTAVANLMTNQPLLHVPIMDKYKIDNIQKYNQDQVANPNNTLWDYEPKKYWPNDKESKVTFIAYYPFQDYEGGDYYRNGDESIRNEEVTLSGITYKVRYNNTYYDPNPHPEADLTCITPPPATKGGSQVIGPEAYTFTFQQKKNVEEHIDFMMGLTQVSDGRPSGNQVTLRLKHTLCAVEFDFELEENTTKWGQLTGQGLPEEINIKVNSIGFEGLYTQGDVYPKTDGTFNWFNLDNYDDDDNTYMVTFEDNTNGGDRLPWIKAGVDDRPTFNYNGSAWSKINNTNTLIYNKEYTDESDTYLFKKVYGRNARGFRYLLLVIPQKAQLEEDNTTVKKSYLVVNYDFKYKISDDDDYVIYKNCIDKVELQDNKKTGDTTQLFCAGKMLVFHVRFSPLGINMDAELMDWDEGEGPVEEGGNGVPVPHEWEDQMDREEETP